MVNCKYCGEKNSDFQKRCKKCGGLLIADIRRTDGNDDIMAQADQLSPEDQYDIGVNILNNRKSDERSKQIAEQLIKRAALKSYPDALYKYAEILLGKNPPQKEEALVYLTMASEMGHVESTNRLRVMKALEEVERKADNQIQTPIGFDLESLQREARPNILFIRSVSMKNLKGKLSVKGSQGTGFIIEGGYVITNAHVVGDEEDLLNFNQNQERCLKTLNETHAISAKFIGQDNRKTYNMNCIGYFPTYDIAILKFLGSIQQEIEQRKNLLELKTTKSGHEYVYTIGNPEGLDDTVTIGQISNPQRTDNQHLPSVHWEIQTNLAANHGNSGGPLLNAKNEVIGIVTLIHRDAQGITYIVPSEYIVEVINNNQL